MFRYLKLHKNVRTMIFLSITVLLNYLLHLKMAYYCCFSLGGNLDFLQKKFYNIDYWFKR